VGADVEGVLQVRTLSQVHTQQLLLVHPQLDSRHTNSSVHGVTLCAASGPAAAGAPSVVGARQDHTVHPQPDDSCDYTS
jgi:hypothetical protein